MSRCWSRRTAGGSAGRRRRRAAAAGPPRAGRGDDQVLRRTLADGSQLTLVADGDAVVAGPAAAAAHPGRCSALGALAVAGAIMLLVTRARAGPAGRDDRAGPLHHPRRPRPPARAAAHRHRAGPHRGRVRRHARRAGGRRGGRPGGGRARPAGSSPTPRTSCAPRWPGCRRSTEAALAPELTAEERERLQLLLLQETRRAARLVDDLLALARIDAGMELRREPVDLLELARAEADRVAAARPGPHGRRRGRAGDRARRRRPARPGAGQPAGQRLPARPDGGRIAVRVWSGGLAVVRVTDDGPGCRARTGSGSSTGWSGWTTPGRPNDGGGGLGLAIARGIARAHGGDLRCVDPPGGRGATFALTLPSRDRAAERSPGRSVLVGRAGLADVEQPVAALQRVDRRPRPPGTASRRAPRRARCRPGAAASRRPPPPPPPAR